MTPHLCLFTDSLEPSGVGQHMLTLAAQLRDDYRISCVCPPTPAGRRLLGHADALGLDTLALTVRDDGPEWHRLRDWLGARRVALFHGHAGIGWEGHDGIRAARAAGVPSVVRTEHLPYLITAHDQRADHRLMLRQVDRLICVSEATRASFRAAGIPERQLGTVRNGINPLPAVVADRRTLRAGLGLPLSARLVLTVGRFTMQKGYHIFAGAVPTVAARHPDTHFIWVGVGPMEGELRARVRDNGLADRVHFVGQRADVPALMAASDLFVLPSLFEGLPLVVLEAMAAGLPVVGTRVCGTDEAVIDGVTGRLVEAGDAPALADAILETLARPGLAARRGAAGKRRVTREFGAARMADETAAIYEELLDRHAVAALAEREACPAD